MPDAKSFATMRVKPIVHHTGKSNQIRSMQLLCQTVTLRLHEIKVKSDDWGNTYTVVKRKKFGKKKAVKKKRTRKRKKNSDEWTLW